MTWDGSVTNLYLNGVLAKSAPYAKPTANWAAGSVFDLGAYEYMTYGGFNTLDDVIAQFTVAWTEHDSAGGIPDGPCKRRHGERHGHGSRKCHRH